MRKIIVIEFVTLDGIIQSPGGDGEDSSGGFKHGGWVFPYFDDFAGNLMNEQMKPPFDLLLGRETYRIFASYWPEHADGWPGINEATKYVVSSQEIETNWQNSRLLRHNVVEEIKKLKSESGNDLKVWGSSNLAQTLFKHDLVDELWLKIFPLTLGEGKRLFGEGTIPAAFKLTSSTVSPEGVIFANYERAGNIKTGSF